MPAGEGEGLFTPKWGVRILNPQKKSLDFSDFLDFLGFSSGFFGVYEDFMNKNRFKD